MRRHFVPARSHKTSVDKMDGRVEGITSWLWTQQPLQMTYLSLDQPLPELTHLVSFVLLTRNPLNPTWKFILLSESTTRGHMSLTNYFTWFYFPFADHLLLASPCEMSTWLNRNESRIKIFVLMHWFPLRRSARRPTRSADQLSAWGQTCDRWRLISQDSPGPVPIGQSIFCSNSVDNWPSITLILHKPPGILEESIPALYMTDCCCQGTREVFFLLHIRPRMMQKSLFVTLSGNMLRKIYSFTQNQAFHNASF